MHCKLCYQPCDKTEAFCYECAVLMGIAKVIEEEEELE